MTKPDGQPTQEEVREILDRSAEEMAAVSPKCPVCGDTMALSPTVGFWCPREAEKQRAALEASR